MDNASFYCFDFYASQHKKGMCLSFDTPPCLFLVTFWLFFCDPPGARTQDPNIKSVVLYLLS